MLTITLWPPALRALLTHLLAWPLTLAGVMFSAPHWPGFWHSGLIVVFEGLLAAALGRILWLPGWWLLINLGFFPLAWVANQWEVEAIWYGAGLLGLLATSYGALHNRVPLYLSSTRAHAAIAGLLNGPSPRVVDLGCGLGGLLAYLARQRPDAELTGVDSALLPWLFSRLRLGSRARIRLGNLWQEDLSHYDLVYAYLSPAPMTRLWDKVRQEMRPGTLFISNSFPIPGVEPDEIIELGDLTHARLLIWRLPDAGGAIRNRSTTRLQPDCSMS